MSLRPLRVRAFRRLLAAYAVNQLGDWAGEVGLAVLVFARTHSPVAVAATWVVHRCALACLVPLLAARLDGIRPSRLLPTIYSTEAGLFAALAVAAPSAGMPVVLALVAIDGLLAPTARANVRSSLVAATRPVGLHREGNAVLNVVFTVNGVLAPAIGGGLVAAVGARSALLVDAGSFLVAACALVGVALPATSPATEAGAARCLREALDYVRSRTVLRGLLGGSAAVALSVSMITPVEVAFVSDTLHAGSAGLGAVLTAWGVGMVLGGALSARLSRLPLPVLLLAAVAAQGAACLGMAVSPTLAPVCAFSTLGGIGNGVDGMAVVTAVQERTTDAYQVRVNSLYDTLMCVAPGLGFAVGGAVAALAGPRPAYLLAGLGAFTALAWAVAQLRTADWVTVA